MASRLAPQGLLEAPREAAGEQHALLEDEGRCREVRGASHCAGLRGVLRYIVRMTDREPKIFNETYM